MTENPIDDTIEVKPPKGFNQMFYEELLSKYRDFIVACAEEKRFTDMDRIPSFIEFIHKRLGNPDNL